MKHRYEFVGFDAAVNLLRPGAKWALTHGLFEWNDPRPMPTLEEIQTTIAKIKEFEESIDYILLPEQKTQSLDPAQETESIIAGIHPYDENTMHGGANEKGGEGGLSGVEPGTK